MRSLTSVARNLAARLDGIWERDGGYERVVFVGHSIGGLIVRQSYLMGAGAAGFESECTLTSTKWATRVEKVLLFAAINRGIEDQSRLRRIGAFLMNLIPGVRPTLLDTLQGSDFISNLRVSWIRYFARIEDESGQESLPIVVQLLGTIDKIVKADDSEDVLAFPNSIPIRIEGASHGDLYKVDLPGIEIEGRYALIRRAFVTDRVADLPLDDRRQGSRPITNVQFTEGPVPVGLS